MTQKDTIKLFADRILKNIKEVDSTGLYNGKAGLSLALFSAAEYLQDEHINGVAYQLLMESIIIRNSNVSFENGLSGVGYTLLYLIENNFVDADFDGIFGIQYETIIRSFEGIEKAPTGLVNTMQIVYFLAKAAHFKKDDSRIPEIIKKIFEGLELFLTVQFHDFSDIRYINRKLNILSFFNTYLKLVEYTGYSNFSSSLLEIYASLYQKGRIVSSLETGYLLNKISIKNNMDIYGEMIRENIWNGFNNIHLDMLSLRERIDLAKIISDLNYNELQEQQLLPEITLTKTDRFFQDLSVTTPETFSPFGYGAGLGRLLIYCVDSQAELL